ncbi:MAG: FG-GAP-like repeat-containing protein, partial [Undibacterium sp.]
MFHRLYPIRLNTALALTGLVLIPLFGYVIWNLTTTPETLTKRTEGYAEAGKGAKQDLELHPTLAFTEEDKSYTVEDTATDGIQIKFANTEAKSEEKPKLNLSFPKDYAEPIEVKLDDKRAIQITDLSGKNGYRAEPLQTEALTKEDQGFFASLFKAKTKDAPKQYLRYASDDGRKSLLYAFQKDQATGEKKLKHWTLYQKGSGLETEEYKIENAKVRIADGKAEVYYFGDQDLKNQQAAAEVDQNLMERAQRTLAREMGEDILNGGYTPDFTIPAPYYLDREGKQHDAEWKWSEESKTLSVSFTPESYPVALDPTLSFTAPGVSNGGSVITGEATSTFSYAMTTGDFNADGWMDLTISAYGYSSNAGRVYVFYSDGSLSMTASGADVVIIGEAGSSFGKSVTSGDFNADGRADLAVGAFSYASNTGRAYIFYGDGSIPTTAATADVIITGETSNDFGIFLTAGDLNTDGRTDLVVGGSRYSTNTGRAYIFYGDGSIPTTAATADVIITGNATSDYFGSSLAVSDFNADGRTDLAVSADGYSTSTGRTYLFYGDGSIPTTAATADVTITGEAANNHFGATFAFSDFNADGRVDLAIGAWFYGGGSSGRVYLFYNDGTIPTTAATADVIIDGVSSSRLGTSLATGDFNSDGRTDLVAGANSCLSNTGCTYIFYNDGSIPTTAATADVIITGQTTPNYFGTTLVVGDFNIDGKTDLVIGAYYYATNTGRAYIFYSQN